MKYLSCTKKRVIDFWHVSNTEKCFLTHFQDHYQTQENETEFSKKKLFLENESFFIKHQNKWSVSGSFTSRAYDYIWRRSWL
jgi:hypothetical protein